MLITGFRINKGVELYTIEAGNEHLFGIDESENLFDMIFASQVIEDSILICSLARDQNRYTVTRIRGEEHGKYSTIGRSGKSS